MPWPASLFSLRRLVGSPGSGTGSQNTSLALVPKGHDGHIVSRRSPLRSGRPGRQGLLRIKTWRSLPPHFGHSFHITAQTQEICSEEPGGKEEKRRDLHPSPWPFQRLLWRIVATMRRTLGLSILWAFAAGNLCAAAEIPVKPGFEAYKLTGRWYSIAWVTNHTDQAHLMTVGKYIMPTSRDDLDIDFYFIEDEECYLEILSFSHGEKMGQLLTVSDNPDLDGYKVHIVDTDYEEYNIFQMERDNKDALFLDGREPTVSTNVTEAFRKVATALKFPVAKILSIPQNDYCYQGQNL